jgi:hypothetical protein
VLFLLTHYDEHYITEDIPCISLHPDFDIICLNNTVLETAYVVFMRYKRLGGRAPDSLSPRYILKLFDFICKMCILLYHFGRICLLL